MKRKGNLINEITDLNNLYEAFYKAQKSKKEKPEISEYRHNLYFNLKFLQNQIQTGKIVVGNYHYFTIYEPKERLICAASFPERVLHHALMNVCHRYFENRQIEESYATRINKGTYKAVEKAKYYSKHYKYYLKLDIRKYFDSISHKILLQNLETIFKDSMLLYIFYQIINSYSTLTKFPNKTGLPIGNLTSQYFANFYLVGLDRFIKQNQHIKPYIRYMDDIIIWGNNASELNTLLQKIEIFLERELQLTLKTKYINTTQHGLNFLSYRIFSNRTELQQKAKKRFIKKITIYNERLANNEYTETEYVAHACPLIAFTQHASSKGFRKKVFNC